MIPLDIVIRAINIGIPQLFYTSLTSVYERTKTKVRVDSELLEEFEVNEG